MKTHTFAWQSEHPFKHLVIDEFFPTQVALQISQDFDTVKDFWVHYNNALEPVQCPEDFARKSLAVYYLCDPRPQAEERYRALYSPAKGQENDPNVLELIALRSRV
jgi:hypothetical protein